MQQTKRRSKKGVILLALAFALLVLAIVPAGALAAANSISINGVVAPNNSTVGSNLVNVGYKSDVLTAAFVTFSVTAAGPGAYGAESTPRIAYAPVGSWNYSTVSLGSPTLGQKFKVTVKFYAALTGGSSVDSAESGVITFDNTKSYSYLDLASYGADGTEVPVAPSFPGPPWADYSTTWFGPHYDGTPSPGGYLASGLGLAQGDFTVYGALAHSVVYDVDGLYHADLELAAGVPQVPLAPYVNPIPFYNWSGILTKAGASWVDSPVVTDGFHWVHHHAVAMTGAGDAVPEQWTVFGWDSTAPFWTINGLSSTKWYGNGPIAWNAIADDNPGSGVSTASVSPEFDNNSMTTPGTIIGTLPIEWTWWKSQVSGTVVPKVNGANPLSWTDSWDANNLDGPVYMSFNATDAVYNTVNSTKYLHFDLIAPHTTHTAVPTGSTSFVWSPFWVNTDVTVTFLAMDPGYDDGNASGVDYTEYIVGDSTSTPPGLNTTGTHGSSVTITQNAPSGPVYLWFRSVDKADPANKEVWQKIFVYIDKPTSGTGSAASTGPVLTNDIPSWWITGDDSSLQKTDGASAVVVPELFDFYVTLNATDVNSGIGPDMIRWRVLNWLGNSGFGDWTQTTAPEGTSKWFDVHINAADDGIYNFESKVSDRAGNLTELSTPLKIDTRAPVTDAAAGWINGLEPYVLHAADQAIGSGVAATIYRVDQSTPWLINEAGTVGTELDTSITLAGGQGAVHTVDFGSVDAALPYWFDADDVPVDANGVPSFTYGNLEGTSWIWGHLNSERDGFTGFTGYKTRNVKLDVTAPVVTAMDPKNGNWQKGPATVNFSGTDVGAGYAYTEWSTDGGTTWTQGEVAQIGGDGEITVTYHGVDKVGIKSADQTIVVKVASTRPSLTGGNVSVAKGHKATFMFNITAVTPTATSVVIEIRSKATGHTFITKRYANVTTNSDQTRSFKVNLPKGKYNIRIGATDAAGNVQAKRGGGTLTVH